MRQILPKALMYSLLLPVQAYRWCISPFLGPACRFHPTCSRYAIEALRTHGPLRGSLLAIRRIGRCHPWGGYGVDLVPPSVVKPASDLHSPGANGFLLPKTPQEDSRS